LQGILFFIRLVIDTPGERVYSLDEKEMNYHHIGPKILYPGHSPDNYRQVTFLPGNLFLPAVVPQ